MKRVEGNAGVKLLECTNPVKNRWRVRWDVTTDVDGVTTYMEEGLNHRPTMDEIRSIVMSWYNGQTENAILTGFSFEGIPVWLSVENQFNYKAAFDLAVQTDGANLPVVFKLGTDEKPVYREFTTVNDLKAFYTAAMQYIQQTLADGWKAKDEIDFSAYKE